jgi:DNA-binding LacI/PurR family transcriptional regulator
MTAAAPRPVMHDVARLAGVSHQTVSRVLNAHPNVSDQTRERVLTAVRQLNYRRNVFARGLVTKRSRLIGVMSFDSRMYGPGSTLHAIEHAARGEGYGVVVGMSGDAHNAVEALDAQAVEGIIVIAPNQAAVRALGVLPGTVPVVALEAEYRPDLPVVAVDQLEGARLATSHLLGLGHRTVWHVAGPTDWREAVLRVDGWRAASASAAAVTPHLIQGDWTPRSGYQAGLQLAERDDVTAVFAANDQMALGVIHALTRRGRRVPQDVSVVGFDDIPEAEFFLPGLTTVRQNFEEVGRRGLDLLVSILDDATGDHRERVTIAPEFVLRSSTAPPGHSPRARR